MLSPPQTSVNLHNTLLKFYFYPYFADEKTKAREFKQIAQGHVGSKSLRWDLNPGKLSPESGPLEMMHLEPLHYVWPQQVLAKCRLSDAH